MRSLLASVGLFIAALIPQAIAVTVYYQPTPFPSRDIYGNYPGHANRHVLNGWLPSLYYGQAFQKNDTLEVGGWGDNYRTYILFDLEGLPISVSNAQLLLYAYPRGDGSTIVGFDFWRPTSAWFTSQTSSASWDTSMTWNTQPGFSLVSSWSVGGSTPLNIFWAMDITSLYGQWQNGTYPNYGICIMPWAENNNFDLWRSSRANNNTQRPILQLTFNQPAGTPSFKLPLIGAAQWLLTNEAGGFDSQGESPNPDSAHQGADYFTLDFSSSNIKDSGGSYAGNIPILAPASGTVYGTGYNSSTGYYIILDHGSGYLTRCIHFDVPAARASGVTLNVGDHVNQGDQIGLMGNSGLSTGKHVHINFWYGNTFNGYSSISNLQTVTMEGLLLKSFQTESSVDANGIPTGRIRYYHSSNTPTGL